MKLAAADALADLVGDDLRRGLGHPVAVRPAGRAGGRRRGRRGRPPRRRRPPLTRLDRFGACSPSTPSRSPPTTRCPAWWWGSGPTRRSPDGWTTVTVKAASLNHHDLWSLRGVGLREEALPMILGCDAAGLRRGRQRGRRARGDQRPGVDAATRPSTRSGRCSPSATRARSPTRSPCRARNVVPKPASLSLRGGRLPADRLADGVPDALHAGRPQGRRHGAGAGRRRRRRDRADHAGPGRRPAGAAPPAATRPSGPGRSRSARTRSSSPAPGCRCKVDAVMETVGRATWSHSIRVAAPRRHDRHLRHHLGPEARRRRADPDLLPPAAA